jgi:hypothetical protein
MKIATMKNTKSQTPQHNIQFNANKKRAENKDNLDHREGEEQDFKGEDVTHNRKYVKNKKASTSDNEKKDR